MGKRRKAREMAVQMLYQRELGGSTAEQILGAFDLSEYLADDSRPKETFEARRMRIGEAFDFGSRLFKGTLERLDEIDERIRAQADNWRLERMPAVDRNILRLAVYEMLFLEETPSLVVVDEAIELAKLFGSEQSGRFINGLLDGLLKKSGETAAQASAESS